MTDYINSIANSKEYQNFKQEFISFNFDYESHLKFLKVCVIISNICSWIAILAVIILAFNEDAWFMGIIYSIIIFLWSTKNNHLYNALQHIIILPSLRKSIKTYLGRDYIDNYDYHQCIDQLFLKDNLEFIKTLRNYLSPFSGWIIFYFGLLNISVLLLSSVAIETKDFWISCPLSIALLSFLVISYYYRRLEQQLISPYIDLSLEIMLISSKLKKE